MKVIDNVHAREIGAPADVVGQLIETLGRPGDLVWPAPAWTPMVLDGPIAVGSSGGHGAIRYRVVEHEPGRRIGFEFHPDLGIDGSHSFEVVPLAASRCVLRHVLSGRLHGSMRWLVPLAIERMHDAVIEDLFDNVELAATGRIERPSSWSRAVRLARVLERPRPPRGAARGPLRDGAGRPTGVTPT